MDKNNIIGILLIFSLFILWQQMVAPSPEQIAEQERVADSLALVEQQELNGGIVKDKTTSTSITNPAIVNETDSAKQVRFAGTFGPFAQAAGGTESLEVIENDLFKITFSNKGGIIKEVELKKHFKAYLDENNEEYKGPLKLLEDEKNRFEYFLPIANIPSGGVKSSDLYFTASKSGNNGISFRADAGNGRFFEQKYSISEGSYVVDYDVNFSGLANVLSNGTETIKLDWVNYLDKLERNTTYEVRYSTVYYKPTTDDPDYCSCTGDDKENLNEERLEWLSHSNQFFNTTLIAADKFESAIVETEMMPEGSEDLKKLRSQIQIPIEAGSANPIAMQMYIGPNEFDRLAQFDKEVEYIIPFGTSIFGTINRWLIRPIFNFFSGFIGSAGLVILMLTLLIKMVLFPLTYKMIHSQAKMGALKPQMAKLKERFKDDPQKQQMETMKMYREFGVNPLGGCMPMVLQMPIWFALYRFFPASIEFRQAGFLWATDLSSYDAFMYLPWDIPFYGAHVSLFTILWAITTVMYTYYNTQHMDMGAGGQNAAMMKYMQYMMPLMFLFFFNTFAAGLTCYLFFSNVINVSQMIITKEVIIDKKKIAAELEANKAKPKKKSGFGARLEEALKEQQKIQQQKEKSGTRRRPRRK